MALHKTNAPTDLQFDKSAALFAAIREMVKKNMLGAVTLHCCSEVIVDEIYGIHHWLLQQPWHACRLRGVVYVAVTQTAMREFSGHYPFFCDRIKMDGDYGVAWHCGGPPCSI